MSKTIIIQEAGDPKTLTADKLDTSLSGGGLQDWIPEDSVPLGTKSITKDGTYKASSEGLYGYSEVTVSGIGKAVGKDPTTGEDKLVEPDPTTGELEETVLPSSIVVTSPPNKTTYEDGETINFDGMIVKAYLRSGELWTDPQHQGGILARQELILPVTTADYSQAHEGIYEKNGVVACEISCDKMGRGGYYHNGIVATFINGGNSFYAFRSDIGSIFLTRYNGALYSCLPDPYYVNNWLGLLTGQTNKLAGGANYVFTISAAYPPHYQVADWIPESAVDPTTVDWTNPTYQGGQKIPVQWARVGDGKILEDTFTIQVSQAEN